MLARLRRAADLSLITAVWCWVLTAAHGIWSFGIVLDYLNGGMIPLYPSWPVTYSSFFMDALGAFVVTFFLAILACAFTPPRFHLPVLMGAWVIGALWGASGIAFVYQIDFGMTWRPSEAFWELFYHPLVTPFWLVFGLMGTASLTRPRRLRSY